MILPPAITYTRRWIKSSSDLWIMGQCELYAKLPFYSWYELLDKRKFPANMGSTTRSLIVEPGIFRADF